MQFLLDLTYFPLCTPLNELSILHSAAAGNKCSFSPLRNSLWSVTSSEWKVKEG